MSDDRIVRVHYFPQQFLRTEDFTEEQAYHLEMRRRHNIAHHIWGIVHGLELRVEEDGPVVLPGLAVDGYGRELILTQRRRIPDEEFTHRNSDELTLWLQYGRIGSDEVPEGYYKVCNTESRANFYRWEEVPALVLERPDPGYLDSRKPNSVAPEDIPFTATRTPPDDPSQSWPVYLGKLIRDRSNPEETFYKVEPAGRPLAGLVGEGMTAPSGRAQLGLEGKVAEVTDDSGTTTPEVRPSRFQVSLCHAAECDDDNPLQEHLSITSKGEIDLYGKANIHGDLRMAGGAVEFRAAPAEEDAPADCATAAALADKQDEARPWRIYRYRCQRPADANVTAEEAGAETPPIIEDELRIELAPVTDATQQFVIGAWSPEDEAFKHFLTVSNVNNSSGDCSVTVHGNLIVKGSIEREQAPTASRLSPEARNFVLGTYASGVSGANLHLFEHLNRPYLSSVVDVETDAGQAAVLKAIMKSPGLLSRFVEKLISNAGAVKILKAKLAAHGGPVD